MTSPVVATVLMVGLCFAQFAVALAMMPSFDRIECAQSVDDALDLAEGRPLCPQRKVSRDDAARYCSRRPNEAPACLDGAVVLSDNMWCVGVLSKKYAGAGVLKITDEVECIVLQVVTT